MKRCLLVTGCFFAVIAANAQMVGPDTYIGGRVVMAPWFDAGNKLYLSQVDRTMGTSRSTAMGGAFASLGADLSSMSINPAGLGMYQSSDFGITGALTMDGIRTTAPTGSVESGGSRTSFGLNNIGVVWNVLNSSKGLTSLSLGFAYNRLANFNSRSTVNTFGETTSIAQMFAEQMNILGEAGYRAEYLDTLEPFYNENIPLDYWGAILGYQTFLVDEIGRDEYGYSNSVLPNDSYFGTETRGGIYEYDFSIGANVGNKLYLGATVSVIDLDYRENTSYEEYYYPADGAEFTGMWFDQTTKIQGSGLTMKLGAIYRPTEALRVGVAFHLPTYYSLTKSYYGKMGNNAYQPLDTDEPLMDDINYRTAPRLLAGISGVIAGSAILAVDYEVAWYNKFNTKGYEDIYKPGQTVRAGLEVGANDWLSLRAGGSYSFDIMKDELWVSNHPAPIGGYSITGGLGFALGLNGYLDVAYVYNHAKYNDYDPYYLDDALAHVSQERVYTPKQNRNMITLTLGTRF